MGDEKEKVAHRVKQRGRQKLVFAYADVFFGRPRVSMCLDLELI